MTSALQHLLTSCPWTSLDLANHLWQSTVVALAILALVAVCGRLSAGTRRALGWMALAKFALPVAWIASFFQGAGTAHSPWLVSSGLTFPVNLAPAIFASRTAASASHRLAGLLLAGTWLTGFGALFGSWLVHGNRLRRKLLAQATPVAATLEATLREAALRVGLKGLPRCLAVASDSGPGVLGVFSPVVILPRGLEALLAPAELESVLIHEFLHLRRRDNLWSVLQALLVCLFWFNPVIWLLHRRLSAETEKSCDERVLEITGDPETYAGGIVKSVRHALGIAQPRFAAMATPPMVERLKNILAHGARTRRPFAKGAALAGGALLLALSSHAGSLAPILSPDETAPAAKPIIALQPAEVPVAESPSVSPAKSESPEPAEVPSPVVPTPAAVPPNPSIPQGASVSPAAPEAPPAPSSAEAPTTTGDTIVNSFRIRNADIDVVLEALAFYSGRSIVQHQSLSDRASFSLTLTSQPVSKVIDALTVLLATHQFAVIPVGDKYLRVVPFSAVTQTEASVVEDSASPAAKTVASPEPANPGSRSKGVQIFDQSQLDKQPVPSSQTRPNYPFEMRHAGLSGEVVVDFIIDDNGNVHNAFAARSTKPQFEAAAIAAVSKWRFHPGQKEGRAVNVHMQVPIVFTLNNDD